MHSIACIAGSREFFGAAGLAVLRMAVLDVFERMLFKSMPELTVFLISLMS